MDDVQNRLAREIADAVADAVARSTDVGACRERARTAGFDLRITLEATVGFAACGEPSMADLDAAGSRPSQAAFDVSVDDRRFLRSLRIAADEVKVEETGERRD